MDDFLTPEQDEAFHKAMSILEEAGFNWEIGDDENVWIVSVDI